MDWIENEQTNDKTQINDDQKIILTLKTENPFIKRKSKFIFEEEINTEKEVWVFYGEKGDGKTVNARSLGKVVCAISFDNKTLFTKKYFYHNDKDFHVYDGKKYYDETPENKTITAIDTFNYILFLLDNIKKINPDYVMIDGSEKITEIAEMCMRFNNNLKPYQGIPYRTYWKERKDYLIRLHNKALDSAKQGLIYTTYTDKDEVVEEGTVITKKTIPKWTGIILEAADVVIHTFSKLTKDGKKFFLRIDNSKMDSVIRTGMEIEVTNKKLSDFIKRRKK